MSYADTLLPEFDAEMATTRRCLQRVPSEKGEWKPHPKSFSLGHLAQLLSWMPGWITSAIEEPNIDFATAPQYSYEPTEKLLELFDENVRNARAAIEGLKDEQLGEPWSLVAGDKVFFTSTRGEIIRQNINHLVHHRGQLSVYLRLIDVPVPSIYGPTADEPWGG